MKKFVSLVLALMLISVFCVPAFAENAPIECKPNVMGNISIKKPGDYIISQSCTVGRLDFHSDDITLTISENVTVTVTEKINIPAGTLCIFGTVDYSKGSLAIPKKQIIVGDTGGYFGPDGEKILGKLFGQTDTSQSDSSTIDPHRSTTLFSGGNVTIIVGIACFTAGFLVAMFVFKKKKPVPAKENEEPETRSEEL